MALFGRRSARQRLRNAVRESLTIPAFSAPVDCSSWVLGGLWPTELATITPETAPLADYLSADLQRIAHSANEKLYAISRSDLVGPARQAAETRVINVARAFAVLRVESTVRQLHKEALEFGKEYISLNAAPAPAPVVPAPEVPAEPVVAPRPPEPPEQPMEAPAQLARHRLPETVTGAAPEVAPLDLAPEVVDVPATPEVVEPERPAEPYAPPPTVIDSVEEEQPPTAAFPTEAIDVAPVEPVVVPMAEPEVVTPAEPDVVTPAEPAPAVPEPPAAAQPEPVPPTPVAPTVAESDEQRLQRLLAFVARQEPGLRWAIGTFADGTTKLVTDIANGWIPSGIELPDGVQLLEPDRRGGTATEMLSNPTESASYSPGDRLGWASDFAATDTSMQPRTLAPIDDLSWQLSEATHWREGLPRMANTLVKAGAAGTGVVDAEIDLLRVHLDTLRYQLLAQYPDSEPALVLNCMLLAATEGIATGDTVSANYHYSWFRTLSAPPASQWDSQT